MKPLSNARKREFRGRRLKRLFGPKKQRQVRYQYMKSQGINDAILADQVKRRKT